MGQSWLHRGLLARLEWSTERKKCKTRRAENNQAAQNREQKQAKKAEKTFKPKDGEKIEK